MASSPSTPSTPQSTTTSASQTIAQQPAPQPVTVYDRIVAIINEMNFLKEYIAMQRCFIKALARSPNAAALRVDLMGYMMEDNVERLETLVMRYKGLLYTMVGNLSLALQVGPTGYASPPPEGEEEEEG